MSETCARRSTFLFLLTALFLGACAATPLAPTPTPPPASPLDGDWQGNGLTAQGQIITVTFTVNASFLTAFKYEYRGQKGVPCINLNYAFLSEPLRPRINANAFVFAPAADLSVTGTFTSSAAAVGQLALTWQDRTANCNGHYEAEWTAAKQAPPQPVSAALPASWCGRGVNCGELILQLLIFGLTNGAVLALNAVGVTVLYSTVRTLNLAHGDVFALMTVLVTTLVNVLGLQRSWPPLMLAGALVLVLGGAMLGGAALSVLIERAAFRPFRGRSRLAPLIATLGLSFILFQGALVWRTFQASWIPGEHRSVPGLPEVPTDGIPNLLPDFDLVRAAGLPLHVVFRFNDLFVLAVAVLSVLGVSAYLNRTTAGRALRACAQDPQLAQMCGVNLEATFQRAFALGGVLAGAAAFIFVLYYARPFGAHGAESGLLAFAAAALGGIGSPVGALASGWSFGVFSAFSDYFLKAQWTPVLLLAALVGLLAWRPTGLTGTEPLEDSAKDAMVLTTPGRAVLRKRWLAAALLALALFPLIALAFGWGGQSLLKSIGIFSLLALGLNLLLGLAGVLDLGYAMSFGIGAYTAAILTNRWGPVGAHLPQPLDFTVVVGASVLLAGLFGALKGGLARRLRGDYLALATLALGLLAQRAIVNLNGLTGGASGVGALPPPHLFTIALSNPAAQYYLVFGAVALTAWASHRLTHSRTGRAWLAGSEDEMAATASGVDVARQRLLAFIVSSGLAGLAGALSASTFAYVDPGLLAFHVSVMTLTMVILGGAGSVIGAVLGAAVIIGYDKVLVPQLATWLALLWPANAPIGSVPDIRGASYFNFGVALYLTVWLRARRRPRGES